MTEAIVERVLASARYRHVDRALVERLAAEEAARSVDAHDAVKRVKRRLHQAVGAFSGGRHRGEPLAAVRASWSGDPRDPALRDACIELMRRHASTAERVPHLEPFHAGIWAITGIPRRLLDVGCGLHPLSLPWMDVGDAEYLATDVDRRALDVVDAFLDLVGQPHRTTAADAVTAPPTDPVDVAMLLKLVPTLDRQDPGAAGRLVRSLQARHVVVSFPARSLGGRARGMERTYRERIDRLAQDIGDVARLAEASVPNELVFVLTHRG